MTRRLLLFGAAIVMLLLAAWVAPVREWLGHLLVWIEAHRETAWLSFVAAYVLACVLLPGLILTLAFGLGRGIALVSLASVAGATAAFLIGRTSARDWARQKAGSLPRMLIAHSASRSLATELQDP